MSKYTLKQFQADYTDDAACLDEQHLSARADAVSRRQSTGLVYA